MANLNKTQLDVNQCIVQAYDGVEEASRVVIAAAPEMSIELSAADGDNIAIYTSVSDSQASASHTPSTPSQTVLVAAFDSSKYSKAQVYCEALTGVTLAGSVVIEGSPDASGTLWAPLGSAISSPAAPGTNASSVVDFIAKRIRLVSSAAPTGGNVQYKVILKS